ncbi:MAG: SCO family protein [Phenylobacterium sp.]
MARRSWLIMLIAALVAVGGCSRGGGEGPAASAVGGPFQLVDSSGRAIDQSMLQGKWTAVFFGYTYCPDFCPLTLQTLVDARQKLGGKAKDLQLLFVSVDPGRDTPRQLADYVANYPGVIGATGSPAQIQAMTKAYKSYYAYACPKTEGAGPREAPRDCPQDYVVDHSTAVYLMDPKGRFVNAVAHGLGPEKTAETMAQAMKG